MVGSIFCQGDQASQRWKSFTCANTCAGGAAMVADRTTRNSEGCIATMTRKPAITITNPSRIFLRMEPFLGVAGASAMSISFMRERAPSYGRGVFAFQQIPEY